MDDLIETFSILKFVRQYTNEAKIERMLSMFDREYAPQTLEEYDASDITPEEKELKQ
jgi:hypothetical protein